MNIFEILELLIKYDDTDKKIELIKKSYVENLEFKKILDFLLKTENFFVIRNYTFDKINSIKISNNTKHINETLDDFLELLSVIIKDFNKKKNSLYKKFVSIYYVSDKKTRHIYNRLIKNSFFIDIDIPKKDIIDILDIKTSKTSIKDTIYVNNNKRNFNIKGSYIYFFVPSAISVLYDREYNILYTTECSRINKMYDLENQCKMLCDEFKLRNLYGCLYTDLSTNIKSIRKHMLYRVNGNIHKSFNYYILGVNYDDKCNNKLLYDNFNKFVEINRLVKDDTYTYNKIKSHTYHKDSDLIYSDIIEHEKYYYEETGFIDIKIPYICYKSVNKFLLKNVCNARKCIIKKANIERFEDSGIEYVESFDVMFDDKTIATCSLSTMSHNKKYTMLLNLDKYIGKTIGAIVYNKKYDASLDMYYYDYCLYYDLF